MIAVSFDNESIKKHLYAMDRYCHPRSIKDLDGFLDEECYLGADATSKLYHILSMFTYGIYATDFSELTKEFDESPIEAVYSIPIHYRMMTPTYQMGEKLIPNPQNRYLYSESETLELFEDDVLTELRTSVGGDYEAYGGIYQTLIKLIDRILSVVCPVNDRAGYEEYSGVMSLITYHDTGSVLVFRKIDGHIDEYM